MSTSDSLVKRKHNNIHKREKSSIWMRKTILCINSLLWVIHWAFVSVGGELNWMERQMWLELLTNTIITVICHVGKKSLSNNHIALSCLGQNTGAPALSCNQESTRLHIKLHSMQLNFKLLRWFRCPLRLPELSSPFPLQLHIPSTTTSQTCYPFFFFATQAYGEKSEQRLINQENAPELMLNPSGEVNKVRANSTNRAQAIAWRGGRTEM